MKQQTDEEFIKQSKKLLDNSIANLDADTEQHLRLARQQAVHAYEARSASSNFAKYYLSTAIAASLFVAVLITTLWSGSAQMPNELEDIEMLVTNENFEFYENLDFYSWLAEQDNAG